MEWDSNIEFIYSDISYIQKAKLSFLVQQDLNDREVYAEMNRLFGRHVTLEAVTTDGSIDSSGVYLRNSLKAFGIGLCGLVVWKQVRKVVFRK